MTQNENDANDYTQDINDNFAAAKAAIAEVASNSAPSSLVQTVNTLLNTVNNLNIPDAQIQADWAQTDNTKKDYIKNKPTMLEVYSRNIAEIVTSTIPLTDAGLHLMDGALISGSGTYSDFVDYIADLYETDPTADYFTTEAEWQTAVTTYGVCGKFVYDIATVPNTVYTHLLTGSYTAWENFVTGAFNDGSRPNDYNYIGVLSQTPQVGQYIYATVQLDPTVFYKTRFKITQVTDSAIVISNGFYTIGMESQVNYTLNRNVKVATVRLPKITGIIEGTTDLTALGDLVQAGLPNITGTLNAIRGGGDTTATSAFEITSSTSAGSYSSSATNVKKDIKFDASLSDSIYGSSTTVQPQTIKVLYYIVVATSSKTDIQVDIDEIATDLNGKADTDLSNVPTSKGILSESYVNGTSWYRVYSDGWCEQGGNSQANSSVTSTNITFLKPFTNTNYIVVAISNASSSTGNTFNDIDDKTASGCIIRNSSACYGHNWVAYGYIR